MPVVIIGKNSRFVIKQKTHSSASLRLQTFLGVWINHKFNRDPGAESHRRTRQTPHTAPADGKFACNVRWRPEDLTSI